MLPYLATSDHNLYTSLLVRLESEHPVVYGEAKENVRGSVSTDLVLEQVFIRSMKMSGGLITRRRGVTEQQRLIWVLSMPVCADMNNTMLDLTGVSYSTSEQNVDISEPRKNRDMKDTQNLLNEQNPFTALQGLKTS